MPRESPDTAVRGRKSRFYCQDCGHTSPVDGDWVVLLDPEDVVVYRCPDCGRAIERRPDFTKRRCPPLSACD